MKTKNSLLFKITMFDDNNDYNINKFIDLFLDDGLFQPYLNKIYGMATHNYHLKIYNATFKKTKSKKILEDLYDTFSKTETISAKD